MHQAHQLSLFACLAVLIIALSATIYAPLNTISTGDQSPSDNLITSLSFHNTDLKEARISDRPQWLTSNLFRNPLPPQDRRVECNTLPIDPSLHAGKTGNDLCQAEGYSTCVTVYDQTLPNGGADRFERAKPCIGDSVILNTLVTSGNLQSGSSASAVSCCKLS